MVRRASRPTASARRSDQWRCIMSRTPNLEHENFRPRHVDLGTSSWLQILLGCIAWSILACLTPNRLSAQPSMARPSDQAQPKMVKVYGAGGLSGLEAYQSGFLVSPAGHIATAWSYVLDVDPVV
ncbi:MAG: serine protease, partial [Rhodopirellula bahusiensis]